MRMSLVLSLVLWVSGVAEAGVRVDVHSFRSLDSRNGLAELCGQVVEVDGEALTGWYGVRITTDDRGRFPRTYQTTAQGDGRFCSVVVTYFGTASLGVWSPIPNSTLIGTNSVQVRLSAEQE